jgi:hypothetical protein
MKVTISKGVRADGRSRKLIFSLSFFLCRKSGAESLAKEVRARERKHQKIRSPPPLIYAKLK